MMLEETIEELMEILEKAAKKKHADLATLFLLKDNETRGSISMTQLLEVMNDLELTRGAAAENNIAYLKRIAVAYSEINAGNEGGKIDDAYDLQRLPYADWCRLLSQTKPEHADSANYLSTSQKMGEESPVLAAIHSRDNRKLTDVAPVNAFPSASQYQRAAAAVADQVAQDAEDYGFGKKPVSQSVASTSRAASPARIPVVEDRHSALL